MVCCGSGDDFFPLLTTYFISLASILGTGILGQPVSLHASGFWPFLFLFTVTLVAQFGVVFATVEILQRAHYSQHHDIASYQPLADKELSPIGENGYADGQEGPRPSEKLQLPNLHSLGRAFIPSNVLRIIFEFAVLLHFVAILTSYGLAGPQAYAPLLGSFSGHRAVSTAAFILIGTSLVVFLLRWVMPALTVATAFKGTLLAVLVAVCFVIGLGFRRSLTTDWRKLTDPFLMGTVALGGTANLMPVTWAWCTERRRARGLDTELLGLNHRFIRQYRTAVCAAILTSYLFNILWCIGVLMIVPQKLSGDMLSKAADVDTPTLTSAAVSGDIATVPLVAVLSDSRNTVGSLVPLLINLFTAISISISYVVVGAGLRHTIDGEADSLSRRFGIHEIVTRGLLYVFWFGQILTLALLNPRKFLLIVEAFSSFGINLEGGLFIIYMLYISRKSPASQIPVPMKPGLASFIILTTGLFFLVALAVDLIFYIPGRFFGDLVAHVAHA